MQGTDSSSLILGLNEPYQALKGGAVQGLTPQMGLLPEHNEKTKLAPSFTNMLLRLQAGTETLDSPLSAMTQAIIGKSLPNKEHSLPELEPQELNQTGESLPVATTEVPSEVPLLETSSEASSQLNHNATKTRPEASAPPVSTMLQPQTLTPEQIKQARALAQQMQSAALNKEPTEQSFKASLEAVDVDEASMLKAQKVALSDASEVLAQNPEIAASSAGYLAQSGALAKQVLAVNKETKAQADSAPYSRLKQMELPLTLKPQAGTDSALKQMESAIKSDVEPPTSQALPKAANHVNAKTDAPTQLATNQTSVNTMPNAEDTVTNGASLPSSSTPPSATLTTFAALHTQSEQEQVAAKAHEVSDKPHAGLQTAKFAQPLQATNSLYLGKQNQYWGQQLGNHITTLIKQDIQEAKIQLDPPELGSLEIKLQVQNQEARVQIHATHVQVRDVLEQQAFRLRDSLAQEGMNLSGFDVSSGGKEQQQGAQEEADGSGSNFNQGQTSALTAVADDESIVTQTSNTHSLNLLDTFA